MPATNNTAADFASIATDCANFAAMRRASCDIFCDMAQDAEDKGEINLMRNMDHMATLDAADARWYERAAYNARLLAALAD